jgi:hypothetical protein
VGTAHHHHRIIGAVGWALPTIIAATSANKDATIPTLLNPAEPILLLHHY